MSDIFPRTLVVNKEEKHKKDVRLLDGDVTAYGIFRRDTGKIADIVKFAEDGTKTVLAEIEWLGDKKDRIRFPGGEWQRMEDAWDHYRITRDREHYLSSFTGADGLKYVWYLQGHIKVLSVGAKGGPLMAKYVGNKKAGALDLKNAADYAGDMLYITFLVAEAYKGRPRSGWFTSIGASGMLGWSI
ncbi:hypothetical protein M408DRAFT_329064 [Serendipita vermifera MAFF 305830]|uniref:DUF6593 domain-containing protein n=1 Tax=Serendipita vermifera MAFF 305830 TaxID=933852 RepID=A0A0C3AWY6_SERVB|nr:hypothetical protein M408DRAFT_329064 [Serendipita vermifera MAFF 305830]